MATLLWRVERILALGWADAGEAPPHLWPGDRRQIARRARDEALTILGREPRGPADMARALGLSVHCLPVAGCGGECADGLRIFYRWHPNREIRRFRVAHGLAHARLTVEGHDHSETDALLLTLDLR